MKAQLCIVLFIFLSGACSKSEQEIHGNSKVVAKTIEIGSFHKVEINGVFHITFIQDTMWNIIIKAESNILDHINVSNNKNELLIEYVDNYLLDINYPIEIAIHHGVLNNIVFNGDGELNIGEMTTNACSIELSNSGNEIGSISAAEIDFMSAGNGYTDVQIDCYELEASLSGTGRYKFVGNCERAFFSIAKQGVIIADELEANYLWCNISEKGFAYLNVSKVLNNHVTELGSIYYKGTGVVINN